MKRRCGARPQEVLDSLLANEKAEKGEYCLVLDLHDVHLEEEKAPRRREPGGAAV